MKRVSLILVAAVVVVECLTVRHAAAAEIIDAIGLSDQYVDLRLAYDPTQAYAAELAAPDHSRLPDRTSARLRSLEASEDRIWAQLQQLAPGSLRSEAQSYAHVLLTEALTAGRAMRVCREELWSVSHFTGWQVSLADVAERQPVGTPQLRSQALQRWGSLPAYLNIEAENLRAGLTAGYSAPKPVVRRVIQQLDGLLALEPEQSPFFSPAARDPDPAFKAEFRALILERVNPAIRRYRDFLSAWYLPRARDTLGLASLPEGRHCYEALLRRETTLQRSAQEVFELGQRTVEENKAAVVEIGLRRYGSSDFETIVRTDSQARGNHFQSADEVLDYSRQMLAGVAEKIRPFFPMLPAQPVVIEIMPAYQQESGVAAYYQAQEDAAKPGKYVIPLMEWSTETRGAVEVTLVHETLPGHHLQAALARQFSSPSRIGKFSMNGAYLEGWARYAERLADEAELYQSDHARIARRVWPARGMVVDPGIHAFGWSREQAAAYLIATGRFDAQSADALIDRIATMPGQLTSYDSGALEIFALRAEAERILGARFDIREFHQRVLERGSVPLQQLRDYVRTWVRDYK